MNLNSIVKIIIVIVGIQNILCAGMIYKDTWVPVSIGDITTFVPYTLVLSDRDNDGIDDETDTPVAYTQSLNIIMDGNGYSIVLSGKDNDNPITYTIVTQPMHGTLTGRAPNLIYIANTGYKGEDTFTFKVSDGLHESTVATIHLNVFKPIIYDYSKQLSHINAGIDRKVKKGTTITIAGTYDGNFTDVESYTWKEQDTVLSRSISFSYTPQNVGDHTLTLTIRDQHHNDYSDSIVVHTLATSEAQVNHAHHAKTAMLAYANLNESVTLTGSYTGKNDTGITYQWKEGETDLSSHASFDYTPHSLGKHILTLTITDSQGYTDETPLTLFTIGGATGKVVTLDTNGGTNNDVQINAALQEVADAGGGIVHLNAGIYSFENPIVFAGDNTILEGEGRENTIIKLKDKAHWTTLNTHNHYEGPEPESLIKNTAGALHNLAIMNLQIDGNKYNQEYTYDTNENGTIDPDEHYPVPDGEGNYVDLKFTSRNGSENVSNLLFSNLFFNRNNGDVLSISNPRNIIVTNCKSRNIGHSSVYFDNPINMLVEKNDFLITANSAVRWYDGNHIIVKDNLMEGEANKTGNSNFAIEITSGLTPDVLDDVLIEGNIIRFTAAAGIGMDAKTPITSRDVIIRNNIIYQCGHIGTWESNRETGAINIKNFTNTLIENNTIVNTLGSAIRLGGNVGFNSHWDYVKGLTATIRNNIITHSINDAKSGQKLAIYGVDIAEGNSALCEYNNVWHNETGNYKGCTKGAGSISEDPYFQSIVLGDGFHNTNDTHADFHLMSKIGRYHIGSWETDVLSSSSINAGAPNSIYINEPENNGHRINMGAYGNTPYASKGIESPPIADAGKNQYLRADKKNFVYVDLDGSASFDNEEIKSYAWTKDGFILGYGETLPHTPMGIGENTIQLTVSDENNLSTSTSIKVSIRPAGENHAPTSNAGEDIAVTDIYGTGAKVTLDAINSFDVDGVLVDYRWTEGDKLLSSKAKDVVNFLEGEHSILLEITDNEGKKSTDTMNVTVLLKGNYALRFNSDSNDEYVSINNIHVPEENLTIEMWMKQESTTGDVDALINMGGQDGQRLTIKSSVGGASWGIEDYAQESISLNDWHHVAYVVEDKKLKKIYVDGVAQTIVGDKNITMPSPFFEIASFYQNTDDEKNFKGVIDELRIWNSTRTSSQINSNKDKELTGSESNLIGYWNFNDGSGIKLIDQTGGSDGNVIHMEAEDWVEGAPVH